MFLKKRNETPQPDRAGNPSGCGVFLCFFLHKIAIEQKADPQSGGGFGCEKRKSPSSRSGTEDFRVATQLAGKTGRSKYAKGYEPFGSSPKCSESGTIAATAGFPPSPAL